MPRLVTKFGYLKQGKGKSPGGYARYISTREGVEKISETPQKTYADYSATRPRAERFGTHGLFTDEGEPVVLSRVSGELNAYSGNIYTAILSLHREDAARLGFDSATRWSDGNFVGESENPHGAFEVVRGISQRGPPSPCPPHCLFYRSR